MIVSTCGIVIVHILVLLLLHLITAKMYPEMTESMKDFKVSDVLSEDNPYYSTYMMLSLVANVALNGMIFL